MKSIYNFHQLAKITPKVFLSAILLLFGIYTNSYGQVSGTKTLPGDYATFTAFVTDINTNGIGAGGVTLNINAGYTETAPTSTGYLITATGTITNPIIIKKSGAGANPLFTAATGGTGTPATAIQNGILALIGSDYVTVDGLSFAENAANTTNPSTMEYGIAFFKASATNGCQNNTIQNCVLTLDRINNATGTAPSPDGSTGIKVVNSLQTTQTTTVTVTDILGTHSNNKFYTNTISNVNTGIYILGFAATTPFTFGDTNNDIGGSSLVTGNTITNYGGAVAATNPAVGIRVQNVWGTNISFNTINNNTGLGVNHVSTLRGILTGAATSASININNNTVTVQSGATTSALTAIDNSIGSTAASNTVNINNNTIRFSYTTATTGVFTGISNSSTAAAVNINTNNIQQLAATVYPSTGTIAVIAGGSPNGTLNITNNTISDFNMTGASGTLRGITASTPVGLYTCTGNTVTNLSYSSAVSTGNITGIYNLASATLENFNNNIISNFSTPTTGTLNGIQNNTVAGTFQCRNNQIFNFSTTVGGVGGFSANGITWSNANVDISNNIIYSINSMGTTGGTGGTINGITHSGAATVTNNAIYDLSSNSTNVVISGININATGTNTVSNNLIGDLRASNSTGNVSINGILVGSGTTNNIFHNTVNIAATTTSATTFGTSAIYFSSSLPTNNVRNNIFVNTSASGATGGYATAIRYTIAPTATNFPATSNNNLYFAGVPATNKLIYGEGSAATATNGQQTLVNYKTYISTTLPVAGREASSISENPLFVSTSGSNPISNFLKYNTGTALQLEQGGGIGTGISSDYAGTTRCPSGGCPGNTSTPDIGAWELNGILLDLIAPIITPLTNGCSAGAITLSASITDVSGVPTTGLGLPVLYWRINAGTYTASQGTFVSGSTYTFSLGAGSILGDVISYYIVAQDMAATPNISAFPSGGATGFTANPPAVSTPPTTPSSYTNIATLSGTYTVGIGQNYTTLTAAVADYNTKCITGNVVFSLTDATYPTETFPIIINANPNSSTLNALTIKPAVGVSPIISGSSANSIIRLNGADFVTIDGSNTVGGTTRDLTIINTNTGTSSFVIWNGSASASDGATNNTFKNTNIVGNAPLTTFGGVFSGSGVTAGGTAEAPNNNIVIENNAISKTQYGIAIAGNAVGNTGNVVTNNSIGSSVVGDRIGFIGMFFSNNNGLQVSNNTIFDIITTANNPMGINIAANVTNSTFNANSIRNIQYTGTGGYGGKGININTANATSNLIISNNSISGIAGDGWSSLASTDIVVGVRITGTTGGVKLYYNSINLGGGTFVGNTSGTFSAALHIASTVTNLDIRNNIFATNLVNSAAATAKSYAIASEAPNTIFTNINNNDYVVSGTQAILGFIGSDRTTLANIVTGFGQNTNSVNINPLFISATNLVPTVCLLKNRGVVLAGITTDILNVTRSATTPDIGAYEFVAADVVINTATLPNGTGDVAYSQTVTQTGLNVVNGAITWSISAGSLPTGLAINTTTGEISGTPTATGTFNFTIQVTQSTCTVTKAYSIQITCPPLVFTTPSASATNGTVGVAYTLNAGVTGNTLPVTYSVSPTLPAGITLNTTTGAISGTPTAATASTAYTVSATQGGATCTVTRTYTFAVNCPTLVFTTVSATDGEISTPYTLNAGVTGNVAAVTYSVVPALPTGITLNTTTGVISGTPTGTSPSTTYTVTATEGTCSLTKTYTFAILCANFVIAPAVLPNPTFNVAYTETLSLTGNPLPAVWTVSSGALPTGITLNSATGEVSGTATVAGTFNFTITATQTPCTSTIVTTWAFGAPGAPLAIPDFPRNFDATTVSTTQINLSWQPVLQNVTEYRLYKDNVLIATLPITASSYQATGLTPDTFYSFTLIAVNQRVGEIKLSPPVSDNARTFPLAPVLVSKTDVCGSGRSTVKVSSSGAVYRIYADSLGGSPLAQSDNATMEFPSVSTTTTFYVSVVSNDQESARTAVRIQVQPAFETKIVGENIRLSCDNSLELEAQEVTDATYTWILNGVSTGVTGRTITATSAGQYQVRIQKGVCNLVSEKVVVRLNQKPVAKIQQVSGVRFCENGTLNATSTNPNATYEWLLNNAVIGQGVSVSVSQSGTYTLQVTQNGCQASTEVQVVVTPTPQVPVLVATESAICPTTETTISVQGAVNGITYQWFRNGRNIRQTGSSITTSVIGFYSVRAVANDNSTCFVFSNEVEINRFEVETVYLRISEDKKSLFLENAAGSQDGIASVEWYFENEVATNLGTELQITPTEAGNYSARVTNQNGCLIKTRTVYFSIPKPVVTGEEDLKADLFKIYPNPSKGIFNVHFTTVLMENTQVSIFDATGKIINQQIFEKGNQEFTIDIQKFAKGMYLIRFNQNNTVYSKSVVIE